MNEFTYECPKCKDVQRFINSNPKPEIQFCGSCGTKMNFVSQNNPQTVVKAEPKAEPQEKTLRIKLENGKIIDADLPKGIQLRNPQNPACNNSNPPHYCILWDGAYACLEPLSEGKTDKFGLEFADIKPCSKNKEGNFKVKNNE